MTLLLEEILEQIADDTWVDENSEENESAGGIAADDGSDAPGEEFGVSNEDLISVTSDDSGDESQTDEGFWEDQDDQADGLFGGEEADSEELEEEEEPEEEILEEDDNPDDALEEEPEEELEQEEVDDDVTDDGEF